jgi:hypothetical protein
MTCRTIVLAIAAAGLTLTPALAGDDDFKGDSAATWSARSLMMAHLDANGTDPGSIGRTLAVSCDGITGEQMHHEYGKVPRWALGSQLEICSGYNGWAHKFGASKNPCKSLEQGLKQLENAVPGKAPEDVVAAAAALRETVTNLLTAAQSNRGGCHP